MIVVLDSWLECQVEETTTHGGGNSIEITLIIVITVMEAQWKSLLAGRVVGPTNAPRSCWTQDRSLFLTSSKELLLSYPIVKFIV